MQVDPGATTGESDDIYTITYNANGQVYTQSFNNFSTEAIGFGSKRKSSAINSGIYSELNVYDVQNAITGAMNYVQIAHWYRERGSNSFEDGYIVFGLGTEPTNMPTRGTGSFVGETRGSYVSADGKYFYTESDVDMNVDFASSVLSGRATNFRFKDSNNVATTRPENLDFAYAANIAIGLSSFAGTASSLTANSSSVGLTGDLKGLFFGPSNSAPLEAGFTYRLGIVGNGAYMTGGAALRTR